MWSNADVDLAMSQDGSFAVSFFGYEEFGKATWEFELRIDELASVEVWEKMEPKHCFSPFIHFNDCVMDLKTTGRKLGELLSFAEVTWKYCTNTIAVDQMHWQGSFSGSLKT